MGFDDRVAPAGTDWNALTVCVLRTTRVRTAVLGFRVLDDLQLFLTKMSANRLRLGRKLRDAARRTSAGSMRSRGSGMRAPNLLVSKRTLRLACAYGGAGVKTGHMWLSDI